MLLDEIKASIVKKAATLDVVTKIKEIIKEEAITKNSVKIYLEDLNINKEDIVTIIAYFKYEGLNVSTGHVPQGRKNTIENHSSEVQSLIFSGWV